MIIRLTAEERQQHSRLADSFPINQLVYSLTDVEALIAKYLEAKSAPKHIEVRNLVCGSNSSHNPINIDPTGGDPGDIKPFEDERCPTCNGCVWSVRHADCLSTSNPFGMPDTPDTTITG